MERDGFTVIELLIAVFVIAILAAVGIVGFRAAIDNSYNTKIIAGVSDYHDQIELYKLKYGNYPKTSLDLNGSRITVVCLGGEYKDDQCGRVSGHDTTTDPVFDATMKDFLGSVRLPGINDRSLPSGPEAFVGAVYGNDITGGSLDGITYTYGKTIQYALHGANADCKLPGATSYRLTENPPVTACEILLQGLEQ